MSSQYAVRFFAFLVMPGRQRLVLEKTYIPPTLPESQIAELWRGVGVIEHERETIIYVCSETLSHLASFCPT